MSKLAQKLVLAATLVVVSVQAWTYQVDTKTVEQRIGALRSLPDDQRAKETASIARAIAAMPPSDNKLLMASGLANLSTEGDFGKATLQSVTDSLAAAVRERSPGLSEGQIPYPYVQLAQLSMFEGMHVSLDVPLYRAAIDQLKKVTEDRAKADFTLTDLSGKSWTRSQLKDKVVLVNFWATWCPPCRKEMPDLETLYKRFSSQGLVILAISDETVDKVQPFIDKAGYTFPILLDPGRKVNDLMHVDGIPKSLIYDRQGKLVAQSIDMRTMPQFLALLAKAGLK